MASTIFGGCFPLLGVFGFNCMMRLLDVVLRKMWRFYVAVRGMTRKIVAFAAL